MSTPSFPISLNSPSSTLYHHEIADPLNSPLHLFLVALSSAPPSEKLGRYGFKMLADLENELYERIELAIEKSFKWPDHDMKSQENKESESKQERMEQDSKQVASSSTEMGRNAFLLATQLPLS